MCGGGEVGLNVGRHFPNYSMVRCLKFICTCTFKSLLHHATLLEATWTSTVAWYYKQTRTDFEDFRKKKTCCEARGSFKLEENMSTGKERSWKRNNNWPSLGLDETLLPEAVRKKTCIGLTVNGRLIQKAHQYIRIMIYRRRNLCHG